jgi:L-asparaginase II
MPNSYVPLLEVTRGDLVESIHFGAAAVVDPAGRLVASLGDPNLVTFMRSSAKPFQAMHFLELGGASRYQLIDAEIAIMCASHSGTDLHFETVTAMQAKVGIQESDLLCGTHPPFHKPTVMALAARGESPTPNRHNCSGKHTGMLAQTIMRALPKESYLDFDHPVQQANLQSIAEMCGLPAGQIGLGIDGCSAPVHALPLYNAAWGYARLANPGSLTAERASVCQLITASMRAKPEMVAGPDRLDTHLMRAAQGKLFSKMGAEGYQALGVMPGVLPGFPDGVGITIKISDGDSDSRARNVVTLEILRQLGLDVPPVEGLQNFWDWKVYNWRKLEVGQLRPCFRLN